MNADASAARLRPTEVGIDNSVVACATIDLEEMESWLIWCKTKALTSVTDSFAHSHERENLFHKECHFCFPSSFSGTTNPTHWVYRADVFLETHASGSHLGCFFKVGLLKVFENLRRWCYDFVCRQIISHTHYPLAECKLTNVNAKSHIISYALTFSLLN